MINQFDVVQLTTTKQVRFMSGPTGATADPQGNWSVIGFVGTDALIAKDNTIIKVPVSDLRKVASYSLDTILNKIESAGYFKPRKKTHGQKEEN